MSALYLASSNKPKRRVQSRPAIKHPETSFDAKPFARKPGKIKPKVNDDMAGWAKENGRSIPEM
jgi:hypothetical protein